MLVRRRRRSDHRILAELPPEFPGALIVAQHRSPEGRSHLPDVLGHLTALVVERAHDRDVLSPAQVSVVPEAKHMLVGPDDRVRLIDVDGLPPARPSADLLLSTMAMALGSGAIPKWLLETISAGTAP